MGTKTKTNGSTNNDYDVAWEVTCLKLSVTKGSVLKVQLWIWSQAEPRITFNKTCSFMSISTAKQETKVRQIIWFWNFQSLNDILQDNHDLKKSNWLLMIKSTLKEFSEKEITTLRQVQLLLADVKEPSSLILNLQRKENKLWRETFS